MNYRRHSSYSNEDILSSKHQNVPVDPRYRDSRPFVRSSSNIYDHAKREFMSRRRSSSSLQEDILRPFQQIQLDEYLRRSSPTMNRTRTSSPNLSDKSNSNWNLNPSILIEEYDDTAIEVKSTNSSTNLSYTETHQPLNEESVAPFAGVDEIPFIDDESDLLSRVGDSTNISITNTYSSEPKIPAVVSKSSQPYSKARKVVSFDLIDSLEELNKIRKNNFINKSSTCDHIPAIRPFKQQVFQQQPDFGEQYRQQDAFNASTSSDNSRPSSEDLLINQNFQFCTVAKSHERQNDQTKNSTESIKNDNFSAYFNNNDQLLVKNQILKKVDTKKSIIDTKAITLNLTEINSDPTDSSASQYKETVTKLRATGPSSRSICLKKKKFSYGNEPEPNIQTAFGNGAVRALTRYFEEIKFDGTKCQSTPELYQLNDDKLNAVERDMVIKQLKEWNEFGSYTKLNKTSETKDRIHSTTPALFNLTLTTSIDRRQRKMAEHTSNSNRSKSVPDIQNYNDLQFKQQSQQLPNMVRKYQITTNIKTTHTFNSCPNLLHQKYQKQMDFDRKPISFKKFQLNIHHSPCHRSTHLTLRKIKQNQKLNKRTKKFDKGDKTSNVELGEENESR